MEKREIMLRAMEEYLENNFNSLDDLRLQLIDEIINEIIKK